MAVSSKKRRDSTRIIYEILLASKNGISKTRAVHESNLNFHLMNKYLAFLLSKKYLEHTSNGSSHDSLRLTGKGEQLLVLLDQLEREIKPFRTLGFRSRTDERKGNRIKNDSVETEAVRALRRDLLPQSKTPRRDQEYQISLALTQVYALQGQVSNEALEIGRMLKLAQSLSDKSKLSEAHAWRSNHLTRVAEYQQAIDEGQQALDFGTAANDDKKVAAAQLAIGEALLFLGQKDKPLQYFSTALKYYVKRKDRVGQANATRLIAHVHLNLNDFPTALEHARRALALFREVGDRIGEDETLRYIGDICCAQGDYLQGLDYYEQVLKIRRDTGNRSREGGALGDIGDVYLSLGQYEKSLELHKQSLVIDNEVGYRFGQIWDHHDLGLIQYNLGKLQQASEELSTALQLAKDVNAPDLVILAENDLSMVLREMGGRDNLKASLQSASEAYRMGEDHAVVSGQVAGQSNMAMAYRALGNLQEALDYSEKAVKLLENLGPTDIQEEAILYNHYLALRDSHKSDEADAYLKRAHDRMTSKANKINDSDVRRTFLTRVAINRKIVSTWEQEIHPRESSEIAHIHPDLPLGNSTGIKTRK